MGTFTEGAQVQFLVGKRRSCKPWGMIKKRKKVPFRLAASVPLPPFYTPLLAVLVLLLQRITNKYLSSPHVCVCAQLLSWVQLFATPPTVTHQVPLSLKFFREKYLSKLIFPPPGDLPNPGIKSASLVSSALAGGFFTTSTTYGAHTLCVCFFYCLFFPARMETS